MTALRSARLLGIGRVDETLELDGIVYRDAIQDSGGQQTYRRRIGKWTVVDLLSPDEVVVVGEAVFGHVAGIDAGLLHLKHVAGGSP